MMAHVEVGCRWEQEGGESQSSRRQNKNVTYTEKWNIVWKGEG